MPHREEHQGRKEKKSITAKDAEVAEGAKGKQSLTAKIAKAAKD